jgi:hypothetical protein
VAILNQGRIVLEAAVSDLHSAAETLEDAFVRLVGAGQGLEKPDWL